MKSHTRSRQLILVGLPGSGKTTLARGIARAFSVRWLDLDREIEKRANTKIAALFAELGEAGFRESERATLASCLGAAHVAVLSTGGGVVMQPASRELLRNCGQTIVYLHATPALIAPRIRNDGVRPMFVGKDPYAVLCDLYALRDPLYREVATHVLDIGDANAQAALQGLSRIWSGR